MVKVTFIEFDKTEHSIDADNGMSLMEVAIQNGVPGIDADCGGACACATCHVYIGDKWFQKIPPRNDEEESMLDQAFNVKNNSRLSCQINLSEELDGLELELAPE